MPTPRMEFESGQIWPQYRHRLGRSEMAQVYEHTIWSSKDAEYSALFPLIVSRLADLNRLTPAGAKLAKAIYRPNDWLIIKVSG